MSPGQVQTRLCNLGLALGVWACLLGISGELSEACAQNVPKFELARGPLELSGSANPWRFINAAGEKAAVWGFESGRLEGWVYPLKIFHDFHLAFQLEGLPRVYMGDEIVRSVRVLPHMVQLRYSAEQFSVTETLFAPRREPGFVILLDVQAPAALRVFVRFQPDLNLMWPGSIGGQGSAWNAERKWLRLSEPSDRFSALVGSPAAVGSTAVGYHSYLPPEHPHEVIELRVTPEEADHHYIPIVATGGIRDTYDAQETYQKLLANLPQLFVQSLQHYEDLDAHGTEFVTPDAEVNEALRWSRVALDQLKVCNPHVGCSYVSGYGSSGTGTRPMYAWFFDEPTVTSWAYLAYGGVESMKEAFRFIQKYQREDGKIPHEVAQSAGYIDWFKDYPYAYIHPDSPLWYLVAMGHFLRFSGDDAFMKESWPSIRKAYDYCVSILDPSDGLPTIPPGEWGSMEISSFKKDAAMAGEWVAALRAMREMSALVGEQALAKECEARERQASDSLERQFWNPQLGYYNYGLDTSGQSVTHLNPMIGYSAWLGSLPEERAQAVLERLAAATFLSDWGQRNMSLEDPRYTEGSYHIGSVWPFMTAGPMLGQYRYHNAVQGFVMWMSMIHLRLFDARGAMPEVLSGSFYRKLDNGVPHQMFSELAVVPGLVNGVLGLEPDVPRRALDWSPHLPPSWPHVSVRKFPFGKEQLHIELHQAPGGLTADLETSGAAPLSLRFSPALPAGSTVLSVLEDGKPVQFQIESHNSDVHAQIKVMVLKKSKIEVRYQPGVAIEMVWRPLLEGETSHNLRVLRTAYRDQRLEMIVEGRPEWAYEVRLHTPWRVRAAEGAKVISTPENLSILALAPPAAAESHPDRAGYVRWVVRVEFAR